jgi:hypothetical protein
MELSKVDLQILMTSVDCYRQSALDVCDDKDEISDLDELMDRLGREYAALRTCYRDGCKAPVDGCDCDNCSVESEEPEDNMTDAEADADTLKSAGYGTDEDYGQYDGMYDYYDGGY